MSFRLCFSITFLDAAFHGRGDGNDPEWPPSPFRLYQALIAACAALWRGEQFESEAVPALRWLERQLAPVIVAPPSQAGTPMHLAVPNNDLDVVMAAWAKRREPGKQPSELKTLKPVRPVHLRGGDVVQYLYPIEQDGRPFAEKLAMAARAVTHVGWGVDVVVGRGQVLAQDEARTLLGGTGGEVWQPTTGPSAVTLRVPVAGSLEDLSARHEAFLVRCAVEGEFSPVPALSAFAACGYRRATEPAGRAFAAFEIYKPIRELATLAAGRSKFRPFDPVRRAVVVAAMARNAAARAASAAGWPVERINTMIHGHQADGSGARRGADADRRFTFMPLPSVARHDGAERAEAVRRLVVSAPAEEAAAVAWLRQALSGRELFDEETGEAAATLSLLSDRDDELKRNYLGPSAAWSTVTPVLLPGRHAETAGRVRRLLRHAFEYVGWPEALLRRAEFAWREEGYRAGVDQGRRYRVPETLGSLPRLHVRVRFAEPVRGPLAAGAGCYRGLGVFATDEWAGGGDVSG